MKRVLVLVMVIASLTSAALPAFADIEDAIDDGEAGVRLLTSETAAITRGDDGWVVLNWTAFGDVIDGVEDVSVTLRKKAPKDVTVTYPANTGTYTSLWDNDVLSVGEVDFTALHVDVAEGYKKDEIKLDLNLSFSVEGERFRERHSIIVPVVTFTGQPVEQVTHDWGAASPTDARWFEIAFAGLAPAVTDFSVVVVEPAGMAVTYPQGSHTSLHFDDVLESRETDVVRLYIDPLAMSPGQHTVTVESTYTYDGQQLTDTDTVTITITAP